MDKFKVNKISHTKYTYNRELQEVSYARNLYKVLGNTHDTQDGVSYSKCQANQQHTSYLCEQNIMNFKEDNCTRDYKVLGTSN